MDVRGEATRRLLVETAEQLFAERGIESVSLRDICVAAGQRNHSAAQYHFGDRAGLVAAVFEHRMRDVNERRHILLAALDGGGDQSDPTAIVGVIVRPLADVVVETGGWYGRFLARTRWDTFASDVVGALPVLSSYRRACRLLDAPLTDLPDPIRRSRYGQMTTLLVGTVAGWEWQRQRNEPALPLDVLQAELVATTVALLTAPVAAATPAP